MIYEPRNNIISIHEEAVKAIKTRNREWGWGTRKGEIQDRGVTKEGNFTGTAGLFGRQPDASSNLKCKSTYTVFTSPSTTRNMAEPKKQERDFTPEVDAILPETTSLAQVC